MACAAPSGKAAAVPLLRIVPVLAFALLPLLLHALRLMFIVGREFDERFPYERIEALARQPLAFLRLSVKRSARLRRGSIGRFVQTGTKSISLVCSISVHAAALGLVC